MSSHWAIRKAAVCPSGSYSTTSYTALLSTIFWQAFLTCRLSHASFLDQTSSKTFLLGHHLTDKVTRVASIGIFWFIKVEGRPSTLLADLCAVAAGETYGDFRSFGGHYEYWEKLTALGAGELRRRGLPVVPVWSEYEEWPRGRVVYHALTERFVVYADQKLHQIPILELIVNRFGLPNRRFDLRGDPHYVSTRKAELL